MRHSDKVTSPSKVLTGATGKEQGENHNFEGPSIATSFPHALRIAPFHLLAAPIGDQVGFLSGEPLVAFWEVGSPRECRHFGRCPGCEASEFASL